MGREVVKEEEKCDASSKQQEWLLFLVLLHGLAERVVAVVRPARRVVLVGPVPVVVALVKRVGRVPAPAVGHRAGAEVPQRLGRVERRVHVREEVGRDLLCTARDER